MQTRENAIAQAFVELADALVADFDTGDLLHRLIDHTLALVDADAAGIMIADGSGQLQLLASSSHEVRLLELFELQVDTGPCMDAYGSGTPVSVPDLASMRSRWPAFTPTVEAAGFASAQAIPMRLRNDVIGAFNVFRTQEGPLQGGDLDLIRAMADVATVALVTDRTLNARQVLADQLQDALSSRVVLEQAKGMLAERAGIDPGQAFTLMRDRARRSGRHLRSVALDVIAGQGRPSPD